MPLDQMPDHPGIVPSDVQTLRELAAAGLLAEACEENETFARLRAAAYDMVWPLVWVRHTKRIEEAKGHHSCASLFGRMQSACLDGFHDDVEAVVDYLFSYAKNPIRNLEGWIASRITAATVDGHRRRRGRRGALQRIRVPRWLGEGLGDDEWLVALAARIIEWAGVPGTAGIETWPLDAWSDMRAAITGDRAGSTPAGVAADVKHVLATMSRTRPTWFADYVERPMGHKQFPVGICADTDESADGSAAADDLMRAERDDAVLARLAAAATDAISSGLAAGCDPAELVPRIVRALFIGSSASDLEHMHSADRDEWLSSVLADQRTVVRLVNDVLAAIDAPGAD